uniref:Uncharacterized protein n=1 Tax=Cucumis melo TaxID=3656 RepID=A0A9I9EMX6_CUCME
MVVSLENDFGCKIGSCPSTCLGLPSMVNLSLSPFGSPTFKRLRKDLILVLIYLKSEGGRLALIQATLNNLLTYYLSLLKLSSKVAAHIEKL